MCAETHLGSTVFQSAAYMQNNKCSINVRLCGGLENTIANAHHVSMYIIHLLPPIS